MSEIFVLVVFSITTLNVLLWLLKEVIVRSRNVNKIKQQADKQEQQKTTETDDNI